LAAGRVRKAGELPRNVAMATAPARHASLSDG
jgi:hypothetical protein